MKREVSHKTAIKIFNSVKHKMKKWCFVNKNNRLYNDKFDNLNARTQAAFMFFAEWHLKEMKKNERRVENGTK